jgi:hypothetical protein
LFALRILCVCYLLRLPGGGAPDPPAASGTVTARAILGGGGGGLVGLHRGAGILGVAVQVECGKQTLRNQVSTSEAQGLERKQVAFKRYGSTGLLQLVQPPPRRRRRREPRIREAHSLRRL